jgi:hypothetical protein
LLRRVGITGPKQYCEFLEFCQKADEEAVSMSTQNVMILVVDGMLCTFLVQEDTSEGYNEPFRLSPAELRAVIGGSATCVLMVLFFDDLVTVCVEEFLDVKEHDSETKLYRDTLQLMSNVIRFVSERPYKLVVFLRYYAGFGNRLNSGASEGQ